MDLDQPSLLWDEPDTYESCSEGVQTSGSLVYCIHPDAQNPGLIRDYSAFDCASDQSLFSTTDPPGSFTALCPIFSPEDHPPESTASYQEWLDLNLRSHDEPDIIERSSSSLSDASVSSLQSCEISPSRPPPPPSSLVSDEVATLPFPQGYEKKDSYEGLCDFSTIRNGIDSGLTAPRKRGRPRKDAIPSARPTRPCDRRSDVRSPRMPHNEVERKYREGLNAALERLRRAVPTLPQGGQDGAIGAPRPSKSMIIAEAIEYIKRLERDKAIALRNFETFETRRLYKSGK